MSFDISKIINIDKLITYKSLNLEYIISKENNILDKNKNIIGLISNLGNETFLQIKKISEYNPIKNKIFGYELNTLKYNIYANFLNNSKIENLKYDNLVYYKDYIESKVKHKKDSDYKYINEINEVFVTGIEYLNKIEKPQNKLINTNYWENIKNPYYQPLSKSIESFINENLVENSK